EIGFWSVASHQIILVPAQARGEPRSVPPGIGIDLTLAKDQTRSRKAAHLATGLFSKIFIKEISYLRSVGKLSHATLWAAARSTSRVLLSLCALRKIASSRGTIDLVYSYWNETEAYGAVLARRLGYVRRVVSRAHRYDIYADGRRNAYMPLKHQFIHDFDAVYPVSEDGRDHLARTYGLTSRRAMVRALGVAMPPRMARVTGNDACRVVSISFCIPVKRIDRIIYSLALTAQQMPEMSFHWTHVGGGPLLTELQDLASTVLSRCDNLRFTFLGAVGHDDVLDLLLETPVDMFLNLSESEGVPVSIMEAMGCGIPAVAPDVGGMRELVGYGGGLLLDRAPEISDIAANLVKFVSIAKQATTRQCARMHVSATYNASKNYSAFVEECLHLARPESEGIRS
ncbi:MAG: glycosyltransferase, partial [Micromonosporaceae bacterium]|nr:glycosyltransferase [Micromonosporaceae bacterium]